MIETVQYSTNNGFLQIDQHWRLSLIRLMNLWSPFFFVKSKNPSDPFFYCEAAVCISHGGEVKLTIRCIPSDS